MCTSRELLQYFSERQYKQKTSPKSYKTEIKIFANPKQPGPEKLVMTTNLEKKKSKFKTNRSFTNCNRIKFRADKSKFKHDLMCNLQI